MPYHYRRAPRRAEIGQGKRIATRKIDSDPHRGKTFLSSRMLKIRRRKNKNLELETKCLERMLDQKNPSKLAEEDQPSFEGRTPGNKGHSGRKQIHVSGSRTTNTKNQKLEDSS